MNLKLFVYIILISTTLLNASDKIVDSDNDSISDKFDKCPGTPDGVCVTKDGCTKELKRIIHFESSSDKITPEYMKKLSSINEIGVECFGYNIVLIGHTDSTADEKYNLKLSKNRALSVKKELLKNGIDPKRITIKWFGETKPIATNVTKEGRFMNRRVEILFN